jgi:hypothetical protein
MWSAAQRIRNNVQNIRQQRRMMRELDMASPRVREELVEALRRAEDYDG